MPSKMGKIKYPVFSSLCRRRLNHHGRLGPPGNENLFIGGVTPPLRVAFYGKACGERIHHPTERALALPVP
jgi:hypothetical protein